MCMACPDHAAGLMHSYGLPDVVGGLVSAEVSDFVSDLTIHPDSCSA
jgi:hypothetical protein